MGKHKREKVELRVMTIADCHGSLQKQELVLGYRGEKPDIILLLGDNFINDLDLCMTFFKENNLEKCLILGIVGNHEDKNILNKYPLIKNVDRTVYYHKGIRIGGFSGSIKYKNEDNIYQLWTNKESEELLKELNPVDILVTHDQPCFNKPIEMDAHSGLTGIAKYIKEKHPFINIHGHTHERDKESISYRPKLFGKKYSTIIQSCYRVESFDLTIVRDIK